MQKREPEDLINALYSDVLGKEAYVAWLRYTKRSTTPVKALVELLPEWNGLGPDVQNLWTEVAFAVVQAYESAPLAILLGAMQTALTEAIEEQEQKPSDEKPPQK